MRSTSVFCGFLAILSYACCFDIVAYLNETGFNEHARRLAASPSFLTVIQDRTDITILAQHDECWIISDRYTKYTDADKLAYYVLDMRIDTLPSLNLVNQSLLVDTLLTYAAYPMRPQITEVVQFIYPVPNGNTTELVTGFQGGLSSMQTINQFTNDTFLLNETMPAFYEMSYWGDVVGDVLLPAAEVSTTLEFVGSRNLSTDLAFSYIYQEAISFNKSVFLSALSRTNILPTLSTLPNFTIFAPADEAFAAVASGPDGIDSMDISALTDLLLGHIVLNATLYEQVLYEGAESSLQAANGGELVVTLFPRSHNNISLGKSIFVNNAKVDDFSFFLPNGILYLIDEVLYVNSVAATAAIPTSSASNGFVANPSASSGVVALTISATTTPILTEGGGVVVGTTPSVGSTTSMDVMSTSTVIPERGTTVTTTTGSSSLNNGGTVTAVTTSSTAGAVVLAQASAIGAAVAGVLGMGAVLAIVV